MSMTTRGNTTAATTTTSVAFQKFGLHSPHVQVLGSLTMAAADDSRIASGGASLTRGAADDSRAADECLDILPPRTPVRSSGTGAIEADDADDPMVEIEVPAELVPSADPGVDEEEWDWWFQEGTWYSSTGVVINERTGDVWTPPATAISSSTGRVIKKKSRKRTFARKEGK